jgi:hypothetical protein
LIWIKIEKIDDKKDSSRKVIEVWAEKNTKYTVSQISNCTVWDSFGERGAPKKRQNLFFLTIIIFL